MRYNELTKRLLAEGYDADHYPAYVRLPGGMFPGSDPLNNLSGGFEYIKKYIWGQTFETSCGILYSGRTDKAFDMGFRGVNWRYENDNAVIRCPLRKKGCPKRAEGLCGETEGICAELCNIKLSDRAYEYEGSYEHLNDKYTKHLEQKAQEFIESRHGHACRTQMRFNDETDEWEMNYDPSTCARMKCAGFCPFYGRNLETKRGNVYYDLHIWGSVEQNQQTIDGGKFNEITKGYQVFNSPVSLDICNAYVKLCKEDLIRHIRLQHHSEIFFAEYHGRDWNMEVLNIRAERKESRDLEQDLMDIAAGITVFHKRDTDKAKKEAKRERREEAKIKRITRIEKKVSKSGIDSLEISDRRFIQKYADGDKIERLNREYLEKKKNDAAASVQMSIFDYIQKEKSYL